MEVPTDGNLLINNHHSDQSEEDLWLASLTFSDAILDSVHHGILVVSNQGKVLKANTPFCNIWDLSVDHLATLNEQTLLEYASSRIMDPEGLLQIISRIKEAPEIETVDQIYLTDGRIFECYSKPIFYQNKPTARTWSYLDITDQKRAEKELREKSQLLNTVIDNIPAQIYHKDRDSRFIMGNSAVA